MRKLGVAVIVLLSVVSFAWSQTSSFVTAQYPLPDPANTFNTTNPVPLPDGSIYFFTRIGSQFYFHLYKVDQASGSTAEVPLNTLPPSGSGNRLIATSDGKLALLNNGTFPHEVDLVEIVGGTGRVTRIPIDGTSSFTSGVAGRNGDIWAADRYNSLGIGFLHLDFFSSPARYSATDQVSGAHGMALGAEGNVWFGESTQTGISAVFGRLTSSGSVDRFGSASSAPVFAIAAANDGNIWWIGRPGTSVFGYVKPSGEIVNGAANAVPAEAGVMGDIRLGADGNLWIGVSSHLTNPPKTGGLLRISTSGQVTFFPGYDVSNTLEAAPDGKFWFLDNFATKIVSVVPPADSLYLNGARYKVSMNARDQRTGKTGTGQAFFETNLFGYFSIPALTNNLGNPEVFVKVLGPVNGQPWIFFGGLTDLEYTITVTDTTDGTTKTYHKDPGTAKGGYDTGGGQGPDGECGPNPVTQGSAAPGSCTPSASQLCLLNNRFKLELSARDQRTGKTASGVTLAKSNLFGYFRLPDLTGDPTNIEVFVKMLDAGGSFWVFYGGLTDFEYDLKVTDTVTGRTKTYQKPAGSACGGFDTSAF